MNLESFQLLDFHLRRFPLLLLLELELFFRRDLEQSVGRLSLSLLFSLSLFERLPARLSIGADGKSEGVDGTTEVGATDGTAGTACSESISTRCIPGLIRHDCNITRCTER